MSTRPWPAIALLAASVILGGCQAARDLDHAIASTLGPAVDALDQATDTVAGKTGSRTPTTRKQGALAKDHEPPPPFEVPERCVQDGRMRTDDPECALLNQAMYEACAYRFPDGSHAWWITKPNCARLYREYTEKYATNRSER